MTEQFWPQGQRGAEQRFCAVEEEYKSGLHINNQADLRQNKKTYRKDEQNN
jgi:hypothetical protein